MLVVFDYGFGNTLTCCFGPLGMHRMGCFRCEAEAERGQDSQRSAEPCNLHRHADTADIRDRLRRQLAGIGLTVRRQLVRAHKTIEIAHG